MAKKELSVRGIVLDKKGAPLSELLIDAEIQNTKGERLSELQCVSGHDGRFKVELGAIAGAKRILFRVRDRHGSLLKETKPQEIPKEGKEIKIGGVELRQTSDDESEIKYRVSGTVVDERGVAVRGVAVQLTERTLSRATGKVGAPVITDDAGAFETSVSRSELSSKGKASPDFDVHVSDENGRELARKTIYDAGQKTNVVLVVKRELVKSPSEHAELNLAVAGFLGGATSIPTDDLENAVEYLARKTKWDARLVAMSAVSRQLADSEKNGIPAGFYYALFRSGASGDPERLYRIPADKAIAAYMAAIEAKVVDDAGADPDALRASYIERSAARLLPSKHPQAISTLDDMLSLSLGDDEEAKSAFVEAYFHGADPREPWASVAAKLGPERTAALQLDGKLGFLTLNNAPLIRRLKESGAVKDDPVQLVRAGYYKKEAWSRLIGNGRVTARSAADAQVALDSDKYAAWMSDQLRVGFPTQVIAEEVKSGAISLAISKSVKDEVYSVLSAPVDGFEIGSVSINKYIETLTSNGVELSTKAQDTLKVLHRTSQLAPSTEAMSVAIEKNLTSAFTITKYKRDAFISRYSEAFSGDSVASYVYDKASMNAALVANVTHSYLAQAQSPLPASMGTVDGADAGTSVKSYPTLEELFGSLDFCECEDCESVLSPAAYFVDLMQFVDLSDTANTGDNPIERLLERRPDLEDVELTCENTETILPYVDLVNEILEYFIVHTSPDDPTKEVLQSIDGFEGYQTSDEDRSEELIAGPTNTQTRPYELLKTAYYPATLPFDRELSLSRAFFETLETKLADVMEALRKDESFLSDEAGDYGWLEILSEQLGISTQEFAILTDHDTASLQAQFGIGETEKLNDAVPDAKTFCKRLGVAYADLVELLQTRFVNRGVTLIPRLEELQGIYAKALEDDPALEATYLSQSLLDVVHKIVDGDTQTTGDIEELFPPSSYDASRFDGDLAAWMTSKIETIDDTIFLVPLDPNVDCDFANYKLQYADPDSPELDDLAYWKFLRFLRLKNRMGWSIEETDRALTALFDTTAFQAAGEDLDALDAGFADLLIKLALVQRVAEKLEVKSSEYDELLPLWSEIETWGDDPLYHEMFLSSSTDEADEAFAEDAQGEFLQDEGEMLLEHVSTLKAALNLSDEDWELVVADLEFDDATPLTLTNVTRIYRYSFLSSHLEISVEEIIDLKTLSGIDPFAAFTSKSVEDLSTADYQDPPLIQFIERAQEIAESDFELQDLEYLLRHVDETGNSQPADEDLQALAWSFNQKLAAIDAEYPQEALTDEQAAALISSVYGADAAGTIQAVLGQTRVYATSYDHGASTLEDAILATDSRGALAYDDFKKELQYTGTMTEEQRDAFKGVAGVPDAFNAAIDVLFESAQEEFAEFLSDHPEFQESLEQGTSLEETIVSVLGPLVEDLKKIRIQETLSESLKTDIEVMQTLLGGEAEGDSGSRFVLQGVAGAEAADDFTGLSTNGVSMEVRNGDDLTGDTIAEAETIGSIAFDGVNQSLPQNTSDASLNVSARWRFLLVPPTNEYYNLELEADDASNVSLTIDGETIDLSDDGGTWSNVEAILFEAGVPHVCELTALKIRTKAILRWQAKDKLSEQVPSSALLPYAAFDSFKSTYLRLLKAVRMIDGLELSADEVLYLCSRDPYLVGGRSFFSSLPVATGTNESDDQALFDVVTEFLDYVELREGLEIEGDTLVEVLEDPAAQDETGAYELLLATSWDEDSLRAAVSRVVGEAADTGAALASITSVERFVRIVEAMKVAESTGISASTLTAVARPAPDADMASQLEDSVRSKYSHDSWLEALKTISDLQRSMRREAMVAYILARFQLDEETAGIDTADKLLEYFLIDVSMDPCMQTSRLKQAISSVQLFIFRCFLGLEDGIDAGDLDADKWTWMKRYRVWEANRKVFLTPENWLDGSLRTTKSPIFQEFEGELLQSDITDDAATTAYLNYLEKLDRIAQLEICGMCREYGEDSEGGEWVATERIHVVGRTTGAKREYYHRTYDGTWSAWEKIGVDVEEGPVIPVHWNGCLFLFWTSVVQSAQDAPSFEAGTDATELDVSTLGGGPRLRIGVNLCWSEFYNGKWQPKTTSDFDDPVTFDVDGTFLRSSLGLKYQVRSDHETLEVSVTLDGSDSNPNPFLLRNKHNAPTHDSTGSGGFFTVTRDVDGVEVGLCVTYAVQVGGISLGSPPRFSKVKHVLTSESFPRTRDFSHEPEDVYGDPFFAQDGEHLFFIEPSVAEQRISLFPSFGLEATEEIGGSAKVWKQPQLVASPEIESGPELPSVLKHQIVGEKGETLVTRVSTSPSAFVTGGVFFGPSGKWSSGGAD